MMMRARPPSESRPQRSRHSSRPPCQPCRRKGLRYKAPSTGREWGGPWWCRLGGASQTRFPVPHQHGNVYPPRRSPAPPAAAAACDMAWSSRVFVLALPLALVAAVLEPDLYLVVESELRWAAILSRSGALRYRCCCEPVFQFIDLRLGEQHPWLALLPLLQ